MMLDKDETRFNWKLKCKICTETLFLFNETKSAVEEMINLQMFKTKTKPVHKHEMTAEIQ